MLLCGGNHVVGDICGNVKLTWPNVAHSTDVAGKVRGASSGEDVNRIWRKDLGDANATSTPDGTALPFYSRRRSGELDERYMLPCKSVMLDVGGRSGVFGGRELSWRDVTDASEGVPECLITSGGFSASEDFARKQTVVEVLASFGDV